MAAAPEDDNLESADTNNLGGSQGRLSGIFSQRGPLIISIGAGIAFLVLACLFVYLLLREDEAETPTPNPEPAEETALDTDVFPYLSISDSGSISQTLETPIFIDISGEQFTVKAEILPASGPWIPVIDNETTAAWVYGSIINYIFGLDDTSENRELLEDLVEGDEVVLSTRSGMQSTFNVSSRQEVPGDDREVFAQRSPGITLMLIGNDPEASRLVIQGRFALTDSKNDVPFGQVVEMGQTAQLETLQFTANGAATQFDRPEAPSGFAIFQIDYQVQNVGSSAFNTTLLSMVLADDLGNLYALNPIASQLGNYPPLSGSVSAGQTVQGTGGFQIPSALSSASLHWRVSITGSGSSIQIDIPYQDLSSIGQQALIEVQNVTVSPDGGSIQFTGQIVNGGEQALLIDVGDVSLSGSDGTIHQMLSTNPAFPWSIPPGQTILFGVTFQRPLQANAIFSIGGQSFQITGLR